MCLNTPVAFIIFNRPETTRRVFEEIKNAKPKKLFVIADGPRENKSDENELCNRTRKIIEGVNWDCDLIKIYSDINLGCKQRLSTGITSVFEQTDEAIFLEDDCLPASSFFKYCESMLEYYRYNEKIMNISGINFQFGKNQTEYSYYFSHFVHIWGWASWKRAWKFYDPDMNKWPEIKKKNSLNKYFINKRAAKYWIEKFNSTYEGKLDTWDYQWAFACWLRNGLSIIPNVNLVSNIGFNTGGVHTHEKKSEWSNISSEEMAFPIRHPFHITRNEKADALTQNTHFSPSLIYRIKRKFKQLFLL